jgi:hypothetical protein
VTSDKVLSYNKKLSGVNNLLVEYGKRVNSYIDYQLTIQTRPGGALLLIFTKKCLDMSITLSLLLDKTFCCEQVHQCGKMPASSQVLLVGTSF